MKIAIIVFQFPPKWLAGTEIATYNIAQHLAIRGHEIHVITRHDKGLPYESKLQGFHVHRIRSPNIRFLDLPIFWLRILIILRELEPDIIHIQSIHNALLGYFAKKSLHKPLVFWGRGSDVYAIHTFSPLTRWIIRVGVKSSDAVIALTAAMKAEIQRLAMREVAVIPNGIDLKRYEQLSRGVIRKELQIAEDIRTVIWVGNMNSWKGVQYLIEAINIVRYSSSKVRLILLGDGLEKRNLYAKTKDLNLVDFVIFAGAVSNNKVLEYMIASDIFALPSLTEGFPMVVLEAMGSGLPVVATNIKGMSEIIIDGINGFLVEPENPEQIANRILLLISDDELRQRVRKNNKEKAKQYSWDIVIEKLEEVYSSIS